MSDQNIFTAEKILKKRKRNGKTEYFIKWKGYSNRENTWEPDDNIIDTSLLDAFEQPRRGNKRRGSSRRESSQREQSRRDSSRKDSPLEIITLEEPLQNGHSCDESHIDSSPLAHPSPKDISPAQIPRIQTPHSDTTRVETPQEEVPVDEPPQEESAQELPQEELPRTKITQVEAPQEGATPRDTPNKEPLKEETPQNEASKDECPLVEPPQEKVPKKDLVSKDIPRKEVLQKNIFRDDPPRKEAIRREPQSKAVTTKEAPKHESRQPHQSPASLAEQPDANTSDQCIQASLSLAIPNAQQSWPRPASSSKPEPDPVVPKNKKQAVLNTVITDVTVNDLTITICESKTNQGFFRKPWLL